MSYRIQCISATAIVAAIAVLASGVCAQTNPAFKTLVQFAGTNGANPASQPIQLPNGNLLGVTLSASFHTHSPSTIYEVASSGAVTTIYQLAANGSQGAGQENSYFGNWMVQASDGNVYGTMGYSEYDGYGLIYRLTLPSTFQLLHRFSSTATNDCFWVSGPMVQALDGNLYGMCNQGGANGDGGIFRLGLDGTYAFLYSFSNQSVLGGNPTGGFTLHPNGLLYGSTLTSTQNGAYAYGSLFQFDPASQQASIVSATAGYEYNPQIVVGADLGLYLQIFTGSDSMLARYGTDGSGPETLFDFSASGISDPFGSLNQLSPSLFVVGEEPYYQVDVNAQQAVQIGVPPYDGEATVVSNLTETANGSLVAVWPSTSQPPFFGRLIGYATFSKPAPFLTGFYPQTVSAGQTVTVLGNFFVGTLSVAIGGQPVSYTVKGAGAIQFTAPAGPQSGVITVTNGAVPRVRHKRSRSTSMDYSRTLSLGSAILILAAAAGGAFASIRSRLRPSAWS